MLDAKPSIGGDPEFFVLYNKEPISADAFFKPKGRGRKIFFDGFQAEINPEPSYCREIFANNVQRLLLIAKSRLPENAILFPIATIHIAKKHLEGVNFECLRFGCSPDYSVYTEERPEYPDGRTHLKRYAGGHIHVGVKGYSMFNNTQHIIKTIKLMDRLAGLMSVVLSPYDDERERREYYGQAGTYRLNSHGIEYRTPSSFWITSPILLSIMTGLTRNAIRYSANEIGEKILESPEDEEIIRIINKCDRKSAFDYITEYHKIISKYLSNKRVKNFEQYPLAKKSVFKAISMFHEKGGYRYFFNPSLITRYYTASDVLPSGIDTFANFLKHFDAKEVKEIFNGGEDTWKYNIGK